MHDGVIPGTFTPNIIARVPNMAPTDMDMKKANKRNAPSNRRLGRVSFADWLRTRAEEEELSSEIDDEYDKFSDSESKFEYDDVEDDDPEEFDDFDEEKELDFDDHERAPFPLPKSDDDNDFEDNNILVGRFKDFYRIDGEEEEEAPGGFDPGQAVGTIGGMGSNVPKIERARILMRQLVNKPNVTRDVIIAQFIKRLPTTESTAISYYEDIAREMGLNKDDIGHHQETYGQSNAEDNPQNAPIDELPADTTQELSQEEIDAQDPNAQGIIRTVPNAHLVFKRQMEDGKFEELWIYNIKDTSKSNSKLEDSLKIRREILSGTDIPRGHTRSENGEQTYTLYTMGNAQLLHITGLSN